MLFFIEMGNLLVGLEEKKCSCVQIFAHVEFDLLEENIPLMILHRKLEVGFQSCDPGGYHTESNVPANTAVSMHLTKSEEKTKRRNIPKG